MAIRRVNEDGTIIDEHDLQGYSSEESEAFAAGIRNDPDVISVEIMQFAEHWHVANVVYKVPSKNPMLFRVTGVCREQNSTVFEGINIRIEDLGNTMSSGVTSALNMFGKDALIWKVELQSEEAVPWTAEQKQALLEVADTMLESSREDKA